MCSAIRNLPTKKKALPMTRTTQPKRNEHQHCADSSKNLKGKVCLLILWGQHYPPMKSRQKHYKEPENIEYWILNIELNIAYCVLHTEYCIFNIEYWGRNTRSNTSILISAAPGLHTVTKGELFLECTDGSRHTKTHVMPVNKMKDENDIPWHGKSSRQNASPSHHT